MCKSIFEVKHQLTCKKCGNVFFANRRRANCWSPCGRVAAMAFANKHKRALGESVNKPCHLCGEMFTVSGKGPNKFCSDQCRDKHTLNRKQSDHIRKNFAKWIGNKTDIQKCESCDRWMKKENHRKTCSLECAAKRKSDRFTVENAITLGEKNSFRSMPYAGELSIEMRAWIRQVKGVPSERDTVMCQACGSVMIIGGEKLAVYRKNGFAYCDRECALQDRSRVYRNSPEVFDKRCETLGINRKYPHSKIAAKKCKQCNKPFVSKITTATVCSESCKAVDEIAKLEKKRADGRLNAFIASRAKQTPIETKCRRCEVAFTALTRTNQPHHYCSALCSRAIERRKRKAKEGRDHRKREKVKLPSWVVRGDVSLASLHARSKGKCVECKCKTVMCKTYQPDQATADHIVPMSKGGLHIEDNLQLMCQKCNSAKSNTITGDAQMVMF